MAKRLERIKHVLACPSCRKDLIFSNQYCSCSGCQKIFHIRNEKIYFIEPSVHADAYDKIKDFFRKKLGNFYYIIGMGVLSPSYPFGFARRVRKRIDPKKKLVVDAGCGNYRIDRDVICLDLFDYDAVDIVCDLSSLPFKDSSIDAFVTQGVLEHVPDAKQVVENFYRCTRNNGFGIHGIPFMFPFHAAPYDFQRYTHVGIKKLFYKFELQEQMTAAGPVSLGLIITVEFLSTCLGLGFEKPKAFLHLILGAVFSPIKYLDVLFVGGKAFMDLAPVIFSVFKKTE